MWRRKTTIANSERPSRPRRLIAAPHGRCTPSARPRSIMQSSYPTQRRTQVAYILPTSALAMRVKWRRRRTDRNECAVPSSRNTSVWRRRDAPCAETFTSARTLSSSMTPTPIPEISTIRTVLFADPLFRLHQLAAGGYDGGRRVPLTPVDSDRPPPTRGILSRSSKSARPPRSPRRGKPTSPMVRSRGGRDFMLVSSEFVAER
jgi:hypothetical protein